MAARRRRELLAIRDWVWVAPGPRLGPIVGWDGHDLLTVGESLDVLPIPADVIRVVPRILLDAQGRRLFELQNRVRLDELS